MLDNFFSSLCGCLLVVIMLVVIIGVFNSGYKSAKPTRTPIEKDYQTPIKFMTQRIPFKQVVYATDIKPKFPLNQPIERTLKKQNVLENRVMSFQDLRHISFACSKITNVDMHECSLIGVNLTDASLHKVNFNGSYLTFTDFSGAVLNQVDFSRCDLTGANFRNARIFTSSFHQADLSQADFEGAELKGCSFTAALKTSAINLQVLE